MPSHRYASIDYMSPSVDELMCLLGSNIRRERKRQGISLTSMARMSGMSRQLISLIETGRSDARLSQIKRLADVLCLDPADLFVASDKAR